MSLFVLDAAGDSDLLSYKSTALGKNTRRLLEEKPETRMQDALNAVGDDNTDNDDDSEDDGDYFGLPPPNVDLSKLIASTLAQTQPRKTKTDEAMEHASELVDAAVANAKEHPLSKRGRITNLDYSDFNPLTGKLDDEKLVRTDVAKEMAKSELKPGFEKLKELPSLTKKRLRTINRVERSKTKGANWFNLPATEVTEEVENDLKLLQMRSVLDPKHFYKKNDLKVLPKYFQIGTVQHSPLDYYSERNTRKNKKRSLVDELLADAEAQKFTKRKYKEVVARTDKYAHRKAMKKMKKLKKNK